MVPAFLREARRIADVPAVAVRHEKPVHADAMHHLARAVVVLRSAPDAVRLALAAVGT